MAKRRSTAPGFKELLAGDLKTGEFRPVYILEGPDQLRIEQVAGALRKKALDPASASFNEHILQGDSAGWQRVLQQAQGFPMLGGKQLVWLRHAEHLAKDDAGEKALVKYLSNPLDSTILLITAAKVDGRKAWMTAAKKHGYHFHFAAPEGPELVQWVLKAAQRADVDLDQATQQVLIDLVGNDLQALLVELEKLALLQESRGKAPTAEEIPGLVMDQADLEVFKMTDDMAPGRAGKLMHHWLRLSNWGKDAYQLTPLVTSHLRRTALVAVCRQEGMDAQTVAGQSGINAWALRNKIAPLAERLGAVGGRKAMAAGLNCDRTQKSRPIPPELAFEQLLFEVSSDD